MFLDGQFNGGSNGTLFEYELIYYPTSADAQGFKRPNPDRVVGTAIRNLGDEVENYRWNFLIKNNRELERSKEGRIRIVVAHRDPGVANWMDMAGHRKLLLALRWRGEEPLPGVMTTLVPIASLA